MRILHIEDRFHPDLGYQVNFMAKLHNPEDELIILTSDSCSIWGINDISKLHENDNNFAKKYNVEIIRLPAYRAKGNKSNIWIKGLIKKIKETEPDILYLHGVESYSSARILLNSHFKKYNIIADTHNLYNQFQNSIKFKLFMFLFRTFIVAAINSRRIKVFFTAEENKQILLKDYGINNALVKSGLIGTDSGHYYYNNEAGIKLRSELKISEQNTIILYAGKINTIKQPHLILEAMKLIEDQIIIPCTLLFVGPIEKNYFEDKCKIEFKNRLITVYWHPRVSNTELYKFYSMSDFAVFPRHNTLSSLDAQACKLPVIMESDITNNERLKEGGLTFISGDMGSLGKTILELLKNRDLREELGQKGYDYVKEKYDYSKIIRNMEIEMKSTVSLN